MNRKRLEVALVRSFIAVVVVVFWGAVIYGLTHL
jgi:hypothetical protein